MIWFAVLALGAFLFPAGAYLLWRLFAPERFGGSPALARGEWEKLPWRWLGPAGFVTLAIVVASFVSIVDPPPAPPPRAGAAATGR